MTDTIEIRVLHSYLSNLRIDYIAHVEGISIGEAERIVARALSVPKREMRL